MTWPESRDEIEWILYFERKLRYRLRRLSSAVRPRLPIFSEGNNAEDKFPSSDEWANQMSLKSAVRPRNPIPTIVVDEHTLSRGVNNPGERQPGIYAGDGELARLP